MPPCDVVSHAVCTITIKVSILVLVDAALRPCADRHARKSLLAVSILVLVDAALRLEHAIAIVEPYHRFNPCFSGCRPATLHFYDPAAAAIAVSILVLVDAALRPFGRM